jgi:nucleotide sugar dehydrogenase
MDSAHTAEVSIWGLGLMGYSLAGELARSGRQCLIMDINQTRVSRLNSGQIPFRHFAELPHNYHREWRAGRMRATSDESRMTADGHFVHILCIPTECNGRIDSSILHQVVDLIATKAQARPLYLIVESTIAPVWIDSIVHQSFSSAGLVNGIDYHVCASPRRDWLSTKGRTMASIPKIIGADSPQGLAMLRELYKPICDTLLEAPDAKHASLVKVVENYIRYRCILLASELGVLLPSFDMASVLRLAGTKWNIEAYHPSLGIGGYCIPLAKDYLAAQDTSWTLAAELDEIEQRVASLARDAIKLRGPFNRIAILGIAYESGMKIHTRSPGVRLAGEILHENMDVLVHDPFYSKEEIERITGARALDFPGDLAGCDCIVLVTPHEVYRSIHPGMLLANIGSAKYIIDNLGVWADRVFPSSICYLEVGGRGYYAPAATNFTSPGLLVDNTMANSVVCTSRD